MGIISDILKSAIGSALGTSGIDRELKRQNQILLDQQKEQRDLETERRRREARESQRRWEAVRKINEERRKQGLPELPYPPRSFY